MMYNLLAELLEDERTIVSTRLFRALRMDRFRALATCSRG